MMNKEQMIQLMNENPVFHLATMDGDQPRVRGMLLFRADEEGIIFHTGSTKEMFQQILDNPKAELCFQGNGTQIRVSGVLEHVKEDRLREEIYNHPTRKFLQVLKDEGQEDMLQVFRLKHGSAVQWTMEKNLDEKVYIRL